MKTLTGIVAAAALSFAADARANEHEAEEEGMVNYATLAFSTGYAGEMQGLDAAGLLGLEIRLDTLESSQDRANFGFSFSNSVHAAFGYAYRADAWNNVVDSSTATSFMLQNKFDIGVEVLNAAFFYGGIGFTGINTENGFMPFFNLHQGIHFRTREESPAFSMGVEYGSLIDGQDTGFYTLLNAGITL